MVQTKESMSAAIQAIKQQVGAFGLVVDVDVSFSSFSGSC